MDKLENIDSTSSMSQLKQKLPSSTSATRINYRNTMKEMKLWTKQNPGSIIFWHFEYMAIKNMDEYYEKVIHENKKGKHKTVAMMVDMLSSEQHPDLLEYIAKHPLNGIDDNITDVLNRVYSLLQLK